MANCDWHYASRTLLFLLIIFPLSNTEPGSFDCPEFTSNADLKQLKLEGDASINSDNSGIQLTKKLVDRNSNQTGSVGRVINPQPIHLWNNTTNSQKDFTTHFSFTIFSPNRSSHGDGLTFFLASQNLTNLDDTSRTGLEAGGIGIGRVNDTAPMETGYRFVAVEFDTFSNQWDPRGAHVGVNINSMRSEILEEWLPAVTESNIVHHCIIQYRSADSYLTVSFTRSGPNEAPVTPYLSYHVNLSDHLPDYVVVGISASTGDFSEEHTLLSWSFSTTTTTRRPSNEDPNKKGTRETNLLLEGIGIGAGFSVSLIGLVLVYVLLWTMNNNNKKGKKEEEKVETTSDLNMDDEFQMNTGPKKFSYAELVSATNNFEEAQGGFGGCVYKGYFKDSGSYAAIKRISAQGVKEYTEEVMSIGQLRHRNLVKLAGWCHKKNDLLLVYEYMPNGSLDSHLFDGVTLLSWHVRYNVAIGLASALVYLQEEWEKCVIHRDIKSSNIMLDSNFNARLGVFGLAMLVDHEKVSQTTVMADIFSFGVVLLEVASGRKANILQQDMEGGQVSSLVEWVWELYGSGDLFAAADPKLCGLFDARQMECLLVVGLWCANPDCTSRPSIRQVIKVLNFEVPLPILPQQIPVLVNHPPTTDDLFFTLPSSL